MRKLTLSDYLIGLGLLLVSLLIDAVLFLVPALLLFGLLSFTNLSLSTQMVMAGLGAGLLLAWLDSVDDFRRWRRRVKPRRNLGSMPPPKPPEPQG